MLDDLRALGHAQTALWRVSSHNDAWRRAPPPTALQRGALPVLVYSSDGGRVQVHGLLEATINSNDQQRAVAALLRPITATTTRRSRLEHVSLENSSWRRAPELARLVFDLQRDETLLTRGIDALTALMRNERALPTWGLADGEQQLAAAKVRYYAKLCALQFALRTDMHRDTFELMASALAAWTAHTVEHCCTSEGDVVDAVCRLGWRLRPLRAPLLASVSAPTTTPASPGRSAPPPAVDWAPQLVHNSTRGRQLLCDLYRRHAPRDSPRARQLLDERATRGMFVHGGRYVRLISDAGSRRLRQSLDAALPALYDPALPCALWLRTAATTSGGESTLALCTSLWEFLAELGVAVRGADTVTVRHEASVFSVQELMFSSGAALRAFVAAWRGVSAASLECEYSVEQALECGEFAPHPHVTMPLALCERRSVQSLTDPRRAAAAFLGSGDTAAHTVPPPSLLWVDPRADEPAPFAWWRLAEWVRRETLRDLRECRAAMPAYLQRLELGSLPSALWTALGATLFNRAQTIALQRDTKPVLVHELSALNGGEFARLADWVGTEVVRLSACFRALVAPAPVLIENRGAGLRAGGKLVFMLSGQHRLWWRDFSTSRRGHGLATLITYCLQTTQPGDALLWLRRFVDEYQRDAQRSEPHGAALAPRVGKRALEETTRSGQETVEQLCRGATSVQDVAREYLRRTRGLEDAPRELIEQNTFLRYKRSVRYYFGDERDECDEPVRVPALLCITERQSAVQFIYLDAEHCCKATHLPQVKKTRGSINFAPRRSDPVPLTAPPNGAHRGRVFLAEGPETALSVACAFPDEPVYAGLGLGFMEHFHYAPPRRGAPDAQADAEHEAAAAAHALTLTLVLCGELDAPTKVHVHKIVRQNVRALSERFARVVLVYPPHGSDYNDFNDVHQHLPGDAGTRLIRECILAQLDAPPPSVAAAVVDLMDEDDEQQAEDAATMQQ